MPTMSATAGTSHGTAHSLRPAIVIGALGVVFGDIGTSPIYTVQTVFNPADPHPVPLNDANVYGVVSLIFWSVMLIVTLTYVTLVMRADNHGEGGIMALITLLRRGSGTRGRRTTMLLAALGLFGAALFFGDLDDHPGHFRAVGRRGTEGRRTRARSLGGTDHRGDHRRVVSRSAPRDSRGRPVLRAGDDRVVHRDRRVRCRRDRRQPRNSGRAFPVVRNYVPGRNFHIAFFALAAIVLSVTGAEALYADMGHFGRRAITIGWLGLVLPACTLNYFGQGALILADETKSSAPFFLLTPEWAQIPMVVLATAATVIASQAVITGAFSVVSQAVQLGYLPRLRITHTSASTIGQIYVPWINWMLMLSVLTLVFAFESSAALAYAFGMAVVGTITITTVLFLYLARQQWRWPLWVLVLGGGALLAVDLLFFAANLTKLVHGAWLPLVIAVAAFVVMTTWQRGRAVVTASCREIEGPLRPFVSDIAQQRPTLTRIPGTAVPQSRRRHGAAGHARQCRTQPRRARTCPDRVGGDGTRSARV